MTDYIRLPRSALSDELWRNNGALLRVYIYLVRQSDNGVTDTSVAQICRATKLTERQVRDALTELERSNKTSSKRSNKGSSITLCDIGDNNTLGSSKRSNKGSSETSNKKTTKFIPPTDEEVAAYVAEKGYHFNPAQFVPHYQSKGWKVGNQPMKDWRAACRTWENSWKEKHGERFYYEIQPTITTDSAATRAQSRDRLRALATGVISQSADKLLSLYNGAGQNPDDSQH